jgi:hypothetical protein
VGGAVDANQAEVDGDAINAGAGDREGGALGGEKPAEEAYWVSTGVTGIELAFEEA